MSIRRRRWLVAALVIAISFGFRTDNVAFVTHGIGWIVGSALAAFVATPFVVTVLFAFIQALPTWPTFVAVLGLAAGLWTRRRDLRGVAVGMACAAMAHAAFLAWLFQSWSGLERI